MRDIPPYRLALLTTGLVFLGLLVSLAPTVTFWDAGEFIAAAKILGIPHPPGTPLFVLLGHVWGTFVPIGEFALRTNILSALFSAFGAGAFFLVVHEALGGFVDGLDPKPARVIRVGSAMAAALIGAFTFTNWQNSNETEVYAVATFMIGAVCWLCLLWRRQRGGPRAVRTLLLILYLAGLSIGNHLLTLLAGGGVVLFLWATLRAEPSPDPVTRKREWAEVACMAALWALLIGMGLGNTKLTILGGLLFLGAVVLAFQARILRFALLGLVIASIGITSYGYVWIRAEKKPALNEAAPDNFRSVLAVIRREQYPPRTPLDDPTVQSGQGNPGRTLSLLSVQFQGYFMYFDWQWANGIRGGLGKVEWRTLITVLFLVLGLRGLLLHFGRDRPSWWLLFGVFLVTGIGLVLYMNFKPGFSLGYDKWPNPQDHEVRERDYFFVVSFIIWGLWAGVALAGIGRWLFERYRTLLLPAGTFVIVGLVPFAGNFTAATRRQTPDARLAADFAYDLLNSVPPYSVLFTYGDNDTFPLWWAQEVEGIRQDVSVVCLALAQTSWYMRQLRDTPIRAFDESAAPVIWRGRNPVRPDWPLLSLTDQQIAQITQTATVLERPQGVDLGPAQYVLQPNRLINPNEIATARILQENFGRRPIYFSMTTGRDFHGLQSLILQQGLVYRVSTTPVDTTKFNVDTRRVYGALLDVGRTDTLVWQVYRYAGLLDGKNLDHLENTGRGMAWNLGIPFTQLAFAYQARGDRQRMIANLERASQLVPDPNLREALRQARLEPLTGGESPDSVSGGQ